MSKTQFPSIPQALLEALEGQFRDRIPSNVPSPEDTGVLVGQQQVVRFLRRVFERQNNPKEML